MFIAFILVWLLLIGCCYLPVFTVFHDHSERVSLPQAGMYLMLGMASLGVFVILAKFSGVDMRASIIPTMAIGLYGLFRHGKRAFPPVPKPMFDIHFLITLGINAVYFLHIFVPGWLMGRGAYPAVFFGVDTPYLLSAIHALIRDDSWLPHSLNMLGMPIRYYLGAESFCALLAQITGLTPHTAAFLVYMPITTLGVLSVTWLLISRPKLPRPMLWLGTLLVLFHSPYPISSLYGALHGPLLAIPSKLFSTYLDVQIFDTGYPPFSNPFGHFLAGVVFYGLQRHARRSSLALSAFATALLMVFKPTSFIVIGLGFGLWSLYRLYQTHQFRFILFPGVALGIGLLLQRFSRWESDVAIVIAPGQMFMDAIRLMNFSGSLFLYALPLFALWPIRKKLSPDHIFCYGCFIVPALCLANLFAFTIHQKIYKNGLWENLHPVEFFFVLFIYAMIRVNWELFSPHVRRGIVMAVVIVTGLPFGHKALFTVISLTAPEYGHEYVNNSLLGEALATIPVKDTLLVTNDFRYPADNYKRDLRQLQFTALFGHQAYAIDFYHDQYYDADNRLALQQRFRQPVWDSELTQIASQLGWTHLVIHRVSPHPTQIPLSRVFENDAYQVYAFPRS